AGVCSAARSTWPLRGDRSFAAQRARAHAQAATHQLGHVGVTREAARERDLHDRHGGVLEQCRNRGLDAQGLHVAMRRRTVGGLEQTRKVLWAEAHFLREAAQRQLGAELLLDQIDQSPLLSRAERAVAGSSVRAALAVAMR